ncbi:fucolectin-1-like [Haliotis rubra]|uniref:fucolectin-1-like n=1 Tax=Haliotis rubra TaxID=36100 RepID=UPI001EE62ADB|nr:fucolectin-1-like [Haliotis rubra]
MTGRMMVCVLMLFAVQEAAGTDLNHALRKPTTSSTVQYQGPSVAVDGKNGTHWDSHSCFSVNFSDRDHWWQVDLQYQVLVKMITVSSRSDCCPERLHDFSVDVYDIDPSVNPHAIAKQCYFYSGNVTSPGVTVTVTCTRPVNGRYLRLTGKNRRDNGDVLQFCEIQVFGDKQTHFSSCSTLKPQRGKRFSSAFVQDLQSDIDDPAACASVCERDIRCTGFNFRLTKRTCQMVHDTEIGAAVADASWNCYQYEPCWVPCPAV